MHSETGIMARHLFPSDIWDFSSLKKPKPTEIFADILADFRRNNNSNSDADSDSFVQQSLSHEKALLKVIKVSFIKAFFNKYI